MAEGEFYGGGIRRFQKEEYPAPKGVELPRKGFEEKLEELRAGEAAEIARKYKIGKVIDGLLNDHSIEEFTSDFCEEFVRRNSEFSGYHPALVRAVAEEIMAERNAQDTLRNTKH